MNEEYGMSRTRPPELSAEGFGPQAEASGERGSGHFFHSAFIVPRSSFP
jgi:hypothetical protein